MSAIVQESNNGTAAISGTETIRKRGRPPKSSYLAAKVSNGTTSVSVAGKNGTDNPCQSNGSEILALLIAEQQVKINSLESKLTNVILSHKNLIEALRAQIHGAFDRFTFKEV